MFGTFKIRFVAERRTHNTDGAFPVTMWQGLHRWMQAVHVVNQSTEITQDHITTVFTNTAVCLVVIFFGSVSFLWQTFSSLKQKYRIRST